MAAKRDDSSSTDQLVDFFVYAPVGIALEAVDNLPKFIERGRSQVTLGRFVARAAAKKGTSTIESLGERVVHEAGQVVVRSCVAVANPSTRRSYVTSTT